MDWSSYFFQLNCATVFGCTDSTAINYNPNATIDDGSCIYPISVTSITTNVSCNSGNDGSITINATGGVTPYTYSWSNGANTQNINNLSAGTYTVTVTDAQNQSQLAAIVVNQPLPLSLSYVITHENAIGASNGAIDMTVTGGTPPYSYMWLTTPIQTTEDITNLSAGDYIVYVGFNNWLCFTVDTVTVNLVIYGCTDPCNICNYNPLATIDDGSCVYSVGCMYTGCLDSLALNYDSLACYDDSSCVYCVYGCMDSTAINYDSLVTCDDGSCSYGCGPITGVYVDNVIHDRAVFNWDDMNQASCIVDQIRFRYR